MKKFKIVLPVFLAISLVLGGVLCADVMKKPSPPQTLSPTLMEETLPSEEGFLRLLVAGVDGTGELCDVMILFSVNRQTGELWGLQLPRDTYARYSEGSYRKLNGAASALGGMGGLRAFLEESLSLEIDGYLRLTPDTLRRGVDALGGVEICLDRDMDYEDPAQGLSIHLSAGTQTLDGRMAEQFVRYRAGYCRGDLDRMDAQKQFLTALYEKAREELTPLSAVKLVMSLLGTVQTDLTLPEIKELASLLFLTEPEQVFLVTAPGEDATAKKSGASYFVLSAPGMDRLLAEHFGAKAGGFDPQRVFLNDGYEEFGRIYREKIDYKPYGFGHSQ